MPFKIVKRDDPLTWGAPVILLGALLLSLGASALLLHWQGQPMERWLSVLWEGSLGSSWALEDALLKAIPIFLCSLGVAVAFRMQVWNIGAEGQFALGAIGAAWAALAFPGLPTWLLLPLMFAFALVLGGIWAVIPAVLKIRLSVNEIISSLMLNYIAILLLDYLVLRVWEDPSGFPMSPLFPDAALLGDMLGNRIHWGLAVCVGAGIGMWAFLNHTRLGYEIKAGGAGERVARYAGLRYGFLVIFVMALSGGLAGWAGCIEASATVGRLQPSIMVGYGYTAIVVAWIARLEPLPIAVASFLLAALRVGAENLQLDLQIPAAFGSIMEGLILLAVIAGQFFLTYRIWRTRPGSGGNAQ